MSIAYSRYFVELNAVIEETERLLVAANPPERALLAGRITDARERTTSQAPLRLAFIGEFSSGKSSLIAALTGADVAINAGVCTSVSSEYSWQGLTLVDTPGIQAEGQDTDHDRIAREETASADLVLFVVTNELFNPRLAKHLRFILDNTGLGLAKKTALIVNKIDRETNSKAVLLGEIQQKVLGPHQDVAVYFCAASKLLLARNLSPDLQARFVKQSRIIDLTEGIDHFVDDAGTLGRLATPLQILAEVADSLQTSAVESDDKKKQLELIRRQKVVLQDLQRRLLDIRKTWKQQAYSTILGQAESAVKQIAEFTTDKDLDNLFKAGMNQAVDEVERLNDGSENNISEAFDEAQRKLDELGESPLARDLERAATKRAAKGSVDFKGSKPSGSPIMAKLGKVAAKQIKEGLEKAANNASGLKDVVLNVGKKFGKKFRPWEAVKSAEQLAKGAGKLGKAMPYLAVVLDIYLQYREEKAKEGKAKYLASMRLALRNAFADQAKVEAETLELGIVEVSKGPVAAALAVLDASAAEVTAESSQKTALGKDIAALIGRCTRLHTRILGGVGQENTDG